MLRVFLVEDEFVVRLGIKNNVDWASHDYEFCGEAGDGEIALPEILRLRPDIVVTDIKMPFMDGLTLSEKIKEQLPDTEIIILTGYAEFDYAQKGLKLGVAEYLTKPVKPQEILRAMDSVAEKIHKKMATKAAQANQLKEMEANILKYVSEKENSDPLKNSLKESLILDEPEQSLSPFDANEDDFDLSEVQTGRISSGRIISFLRTANKEDIPAFTEEFYSSIGDQVLKSLIFRQYIVMDTYFSVCTFIEEIKADRNEIEQPSLTSDTLGTISGAIRYASRIMEKAILLREKNASAKSSDLGALIRSYIDEHYVEEDLSLNAIADALSFTPNHLSTVFSQQFGVPFIKYLTDLRMTKAKELLRCTSLQSKEIAEAVGYKDSHYFSYMFKKTQGMTPMEYKKK